MISLSRGPGPVELNFFCGFAMSISLRSYFSMIYMPIMPREGNRQIVLWVIARQEGGGGNEFGEFFILESIHDDH